jgi:hypothetical protein
MALTMRSLNGAALGFNAVAKKVQRPSVAARAAAPSVNEDTVACKYPV